MKDWEKFRTVISEVSFYVGNPVLLRCALSHAKIDQYFAKYSFKLERFEFWKYIRIDLEQMFRSMYF